jgi:hypothetical protein
MRSGKKYEGRIRKAEGGSIAECGMRIAEWGKQGKRNSIEAELFADRLCKRVLDLSVPRYGRNSPVHWIHVKIVICTVAFRSRRMTTMGTAADTAAATAELPPFHSEIAISCLSLGTNVFSEASSTIKRYASRIIA